MTSTTDPFSPDYSTARRRFLDAARARGFRLESFPIADRGPAGEELTTDVALIGSEQPERVLIVSSGLHGVEGFLGSAAQLALLESSAHPLAPDRNDALILIHALNPYGFAWLRRWDARGVDLNRNLLLDGQAFEGSPPRYGELNHLLNPERPPSYDFFYLRALLAILRVGMPALRAAVAAGQYNYPRGVFFGGSEPSPLHRFLTDNLTRWLGNARSIVHIDFHTGLGPFGEYRFLIEAGLDAQTIERFQRWFGVDKVEVLDSKGIAYTARGDIGTWCRARFPNRRYDYLCAEFGTHAPLRVLSALRGENQAHHWLKSSEAGYARAKGALKEAFIPDDPRWRGTVIASSLDLLGHAWKAAFD